MNNNLLNFDDIDLNDTLVLTPNTRLQNRFTHSYSLAQTEKNIQTWCSPDVFALKDWLDETWLDLQDKTYKQAANTILADTHQLHALWSEIISVDTSHINMITPDSLATPAMEAFRILQLWGINDFSNLAADTAESERYQHWHSRMKVELAQRHWGTVESCIGIITQAVLDKVIDTPKRIILFSFDEIPPLYQSLFDAFVKTGVDLQKSDSEIKHEDLCKISTRECEDQYLLAAQWAKAALEENKNTTIAIVCPELTKVRDKVKDALTKVFEPQASLPGSPRYTLPFNFSAGVPLSDIPLIKDGLSFLSLGDRLAAHSNISTLLRSPYIAFSDKEQFTRAKFDLDLKAKHSATLCLDNIIQMTGCPTHLSEAIGKFLLHTSNTAYQQKPSQWAFHFGKSLELLGWPGDRNLDSEEFQALTHWHSQLDQLTMLDAVYTKCSRGKALGLLRQCVSQTVFQPQTADSPIQVLGILEAAGLHFDRMWVTDLNDDIWPQTPQPNPFIPLITQKAHNMPHASSERELDFSKRILDRLRAGAKQLVMSYAERDGDRELRCSALIKDVTTVEKDDLSLSSYYDYTRILFRAIPALNILDDNKAISDNNLIRGGTGILSAQAICPFRAFAKYRLHASELPQINLGLSHIERGDLVHHVLEFIWKKLQAQEALLALETHEEEMLINDGIDYAFFWIKGNRTDIGERLLKLERKRLQTVITQWLALEKNRSAFKVEHCEKSVSASIGGLPIKIRRDRVDNVNGRLFHIDYKTGRTSLTNWGGDRPDSPQVPLYAVIDDDNDCVGAAFGQIRKGETLIKGIAETEGIASGVITADNAKKVGLPPSWKEIKAHWLERLEALAEEFMGGVADVSPKSKTACQNCQLSVLCRK